MRIHSLSYQDTKTGWTLPKIEFNRLNLLVGASGVGKTNILTTILGLKEIVTGNSPSGVKWEIEFSILNDTIYNWSGEFKKGKGTKIDDSLIPVFESKILNETLLINGRTIVERDLSETRFNGQKTVKLNQNKSIINLLKEEDYIKPIFNEFQQVILNDHHHQTYFFLNQLIGTDSAPNQQLLQDYKSIEQIRKLNENIFIKLFLVYNNAPEIMKVIKNRFIDIFPFVVDVKIAQANQNELNSSFDDSLSFEIKEKNISHWIPQSQISSGMYRTFTLLAELYLCTNGTVFLIDEFENSLGVNCIHEIVDDLQAFHHRKLQFIITSHHPYIINNIDYKNWLLITRNGSEVIAKKTDEIMDFGKSRQQAFTQLIQLEEFTTGISQ